MQDSDPNSWGRRPWRRLLPRPKSRSSVTESCFAFVPQPFATRRKERTNVRKAGRSTGITKESFEKLAPAKGLSGFTKLWRSFWALADQDGEHYVWRGKRGRSGPIYVPNKGPALPAVHVAWLWSEGALPADKKLKPACGQRLCIRPEHQSVRVAR